MYLSFIVVYCINSYNILNIQCRGRHGRDHMVHLVGFTTTCAISAYHH